jgi:AmiR/NasT family two-component response regulator
MRAWFVRGELGDAGDALAGVLRQWAGRPENNGWSVDCLPGIAELMASLPTQQPDVLLLAEPSCPAGAWTAEALAHGAGLVVAVSLERADSYRALTEQHAIQLTSLPPTVEAIGLAILNVLACLRRQRSWQARITQLQQRLTDRIVIERAKGILVERLGIPEKEAYMRLRVLSRRQRRQIRDIAQSLLDAQPLLLPEMNGLSSAPRRDSVPAWDAAL